MKHLSNYVRLGILMIAIVIISGAKAVLAEQANINCVNIIPLPQNLCQGATTCLPIVRAGNEGSLYVMNPDSALLEIAQSGTSSYTQFDLSSNIDAHNVTDILPLQNNSLLLITSGGHLYTFNLQQPQLVLLTAAPSTQFITCDVSSIMQGFSYRSLSRLGSTSTILTCSEQYKIPDSDLWNLTLFDTTTHTVRTLRRLQVQ
jgi:hypothetical protein